MSDDEPSSQTADDQPDPPVPLQHGSATWPSRDNPSFQLWRDRTPWWCNLLLAGVFAAVALCSMPSRYEPWSPGAVILVGGGFTASGCMVLARIVYAVWSR